MSRSIRFATLVVIFGLVQGYLLAQQQTSISISGTEQANGTGDTGTATLTVNGNYSVSVPYGQFSTKEGIASWFGGTISQDPNSPVIGKAVGSVLYLQARSSFGGVFTSVKLTFDKPDSPFSASGPIGTTLTVTASNASRAYGAANPVFTPIYSGFVNGDTQAVLSGAPSLTTTATSSSTVGTYAIAAAAGTLAAANYNFNYVGGTLTITQATPTITWAIPANVLPGTVLSATQLNATANVPGTFSYSPAVGTTMTGGPQTLSATFTPIDTTNYNTVTSTVVLGVSGAPGPGFITTVAGKGYTIWTGFGGYSGDGGLATSAELNNSSGVAVDAMGNIYIADTGNNRIREVNASTGIITTVAGNGTGGFSGDGGAASNAELFAPTGISLDASGNIYIADTFNNRIREVNASTGIITTVAGNGYVNNGDVRWGTGGYSGDGGTATSAALNFPRGVSVDASGNIYIADTVNERIRKVNASTGIITTVAGNGYINPVSGWGGYSGDGGAATSAEFNDPTGVSVDASGNLYIADLGNNRIREVNASAGIITTVAGNGTSGYSGDGGAATSAELGITTYGVSVDASGNIYIADTDNNRIREVNASTGIITTIAGNGTIGYSGDGGAATDAELHDPEGVSVSASGIIYIADMLNERIRAVGAGDAALPITITSSGSPSVYGNPVTFTATVPSGDTNTVTFYSGSSSLGTATPINGTASITTNILTGGTDPITASIAGGGNYPAATSNPIDQIVNQATPTISISNIPSNAGYGGNFTATYGYSGDGLPSVLSSTPSVCVTSANTVIFVGTSTCTLQANAAATANYTAVTGSTQNFTVSPPTIVSLSPTSGPESTPVTISGLGFGFSPNTTLVTVNGVVANVSSWSNSSIVAAVPVGATTGAVVVTANSVPSNGVAFAVQTSTPTIVSLSALSGNAGLAVTISGSGFGTTEGQSTVMFNGTAAAVLHWSDSSITAIVPSAATTGPVLVTLSNQQTSNNNVIFTVNNPFCEF